MSEFDIEQVDFSKLQDPKSAEFLVPAIVRAGGEVAMLGFMNREALTRTVAEGLVTFFSRSTGKLWTKGETSGNYLCLDKLTLDCDDDTLIIDVIASGPVCHTGAVTCFEPASTSVNMPMEPIGTDLIPRPELTTTCSDMEQRLGSSWQEEMFF